MSPNVDDFESLVGAIVDVHARLHRQAVRAVNTALTLRNWLIGCYVHEYELGGRDRPGYGEQLFERLSARLSEHGVPRVGSRDLRRYSLFYLTYPHLRSALSPDLDQALPPSRGTLKIWESVTARSVLSAQELLGGLSFTHISELLAIDDPTKRAFYEVRAINGQWSVRELKRQIATLLYERTGLSRDKLAAVEQAQAGAEENTPAAIIRNPYVFEFLGIPVRDLMGESHLEDALVERVQEFLLDLGGASASRRGRSASRSATSCTSSTSCSTTVFCSATC
jgi:predicted nuclease of restriction endonuclease-like (RecB) superfamily